MIEPLEATSPREPSRTARPSTEELDSVAWSELHRVVRSFRQALRRGERPRVEDFLPGVEAGTRGCLLVELIHEEVDFRLKAGDAVSVASYVERFPELTDDRRAVAELEAFAASRGPGEDRKDFDAPPGRSARLGRYELYEAIGRGSFGDVHRAWDGALGREVALKRPRPGWQGHAEATEQFIREARGAAALHHPHIVPVYDAGEVDGEPYLVSALVAGKNLAERMAAERPGLRQVAEWVAALADALEHAHQSGVIHRDVKPSNILIDGRGDAVLTDFGLAKIAACEGLPSLDGRIVGTPAYMSPEQASGERDAVDGRTDVFSLGVVLYELLTGVRPFQGSERMILARIQTEEPTHPRRLDDAIPRDLATIYLKCLRKRPGERYLTAGALSQDLRRFLADRAVLARPVTPWECAVRWIRRRPAIAALAAVCAASALALCVSWYHQVEGGRKHADLIARSARLHSEEMRREADATRRHLYAVEVGRAFEVGESSREEQARQILAGLRPQPFEPDLRGFEWHYLWRLCGRDFVLRGHQGPVLRLAFSPDGRIVATAGGDHDVKLWDISTGSERITLAGHERAVSDLAFSPDGRDLYTGSFDGSLRRWDVSRQRPDGILWKAAGAVLSLAVSPDGKDLAFFSTSPDQSGLRFLDVKTGSVSVARSTNVIWSLDYAPDGLLVAEAGAADGKARIWDAKHQAVHSTLTGHERPTLRTCFSRQGTLVATTGLDDTVRVWDSRTGRELARQSSSPGPRALAFSPDGRHLAFSCSNEIRLWDPAEGVVRKWVTPHLGRIDALAFSPSQCLMASAGHGGTVRLWDPATGRPIPAPHSQGDASRTADPVRPDVLRLGERGTFPNCVAVSPDGCTIATGLFDGQVQLVDSRTGRVRLRIAGHAIPVRGLRFLTGGRTLAAAVVSSSVWLYDTTDGRERFILHRRDRAERPAWCVATSPDDRSLIIGSGVQGEPGDIAIGDPATGKLRTTLHGHSDYIRAVAVSPDGQVLASASGDETVKIWDLRTGSERATLEGHRGQGFTLAFAPSGRRLASGSEDQTIRIWDLGAERRPTVLRGHAGAVHSVCFSPDGTRLASASRDGAIYLWDLATDRKVGSLRGHSQRVNEIAFFPDGKTLVSASDDGTIRFWYGDLVDERPSE